MMDCELLIVYYKKVLKDPKEEEKCDKNKLIFQTYFFFAFIILVPNSRSTLAAASEVRSSMLNFVALFSICSMRVSASL
jgi:hypothetical protein